ncbi:MAG: DNRLRE domain-containing protein [Candidatus Bathyarchaeia archaeon]
MKRKPCLSLLMTLIVTFNFFSIPEVQTASIIGSSTITLNPIADAYVSEGSPDANYGSSDELTVEFNSHLCYAYIMFDLSAIPSEAILLSAMLMVYAYSGSWRGPLGNVQVGVHYSSDNTWTEESITWNNKPTFKDKATDTYVFGIFESEGYKAWDVTDDVKGAFSGGRLTEVLKFYSGDYGNITFRSRETSKKPELIVKYYTEPIYDVHVESVQDTGETSNLGQIIIDESVFLLPKELSVVPGSYQASYGSGYEFVRWEVSGGVSVSDPNSQNTTVTVSGDGKLRAVGNAENVEYTYDDGSSEKRVYKPTGYMVAVRFTPFFYGRLEEASFYVEAISHFNVSENVVRVHVMDERRRDIINPISETFDSEGWFDVDLSVYNVETHSEFFVGVEWTSSFPELGGDVNSSNDRNWCWNGKEWLSGSDSAAYMIRVKVKNSVPIKVLPTPTPTPTPTPSPLILIETYWIHLLVSALFVVAAIVGFVMGRRSRRSIKPQSLMRIKISCLNMFMRDLRLIGR